MWAGRAILLLAILLVPGAGLGDDSVRSGATAYGDWRPGDRMSPRIPFGHLGDSVDPPVCEPNSPVLTRSAPEFARQSQPAKFRFPDHGGAAFESGLLRLRGGDQTLVSLGRRGVHVPHGIPKPLVVLGVLGLNCALLLRRDHRDATMQRSVNPGLLVRANAIPETR